MMQQFKKVPPWAWAAGVGLGALLFLTRGNQQPQRREETIIDPTLFQQSDRADDVADVQAELESSFDRRFDRLQTGFSDQLGQLSRQQADEQRRLYDMLARQAAPSQAPSAPIATPSGPFRPPGNLPIVMPAPSAPPQQETPGGRSLPQDPPPPPGAQYPGVDGPNCLPNTYRGRLRDSAPWRDKPSGQLSRRVAMVHIIAGGPTDGRTPEPYPIWHTSINSPANRAGINQTRVRNALRALSDDEFDRLQDLLQSMVPDPVRSGFTFNDAYMSRTWSEFYRPYIC